jgi:hypothetical protein
MRSVPKKTAECPVRLDGYRPWLTKAQTAELLGYVALRSIERLVDDGRLTATRLSRGPRPGRVLIERASIARLLADGLRRP